MNILQINSSIRGSDANSTKLADYLVSKLSGEVIVIDTNLVSPLNSDALDALSASDPTDEQAQRASEDARLIEQLFAADTLVFSVPMYNFGIPSSLKNWIDAVAKAGVTFSYTPDGPVGKLHGKKVYVVFSRGGFYKDTPADTQTPYLHTLFSFLGLTDMTFIYAEGLAMSNEGLDAAIAQIDYLTSFK